MAECFFSLITGTVGRREQLAKLLESLDLQTFKNFELIIADQNDTDLIYDIVAEYANKFTIIHINTAKGLSKARNKALEHCHGKWCAFPDDDCHYPPTLLAELFNLISDNPDYYGISTMVTDTEKKFSAGGYMSSKPQRVSQKNAWRCAVSPSLFINLEAINAVTGFDERLGVGANTIWGSGEETDIILTLIEHGYHIEYIPSLKVFHPRFHGPWNKNSRKRGFSYGCGMGYVLKKHNYTIIMALHYASLQLLKALVYIPTCNWQRSLFHWNMAYGRLYGYFNSGKLFK